MSTWTIHCAGCGHPLCVAYDGAPHQVYCFDCARQAEQNEDEQTEAQPHE